MILTDRVSYSYKMMLFEQSLVGLTEDEKQVRSYNHALELANSMAHEGHPKNTVQSFIGEHYSGFPHSLSNWYMRSNQDATNSYMRELASKAFGIKSDRPNLIAGKPIHPHMISDEAIDGMKRVYQNTQESFSDQIKKHGNIDVYRGVIIPNDQHTYSPNHLESWSSDSNSVHDWISKQEAPEGHKKVILRAKVPVSGIFMSHLSRDKNKFIPDDDDLAVKEEHVVFGDRLSNIKIKEI